MPMAYSHISVAQGCLRELSVDNIADYYLGSFLPDMRYFTGKPRELYHFPIGNLKGFLDSPNASRSFITGYCVHLATDEIWRGGGASKRYQDRFLAPIRKKLNHRSLEAAFEFYCLRSRPLDIRLQPNENAITESLGLTIDDIRRAVAAMQNYIDQRKLGVGLEIAQSIGQFSEDRLAQMRYLAQKIETSWPRRTLIASIVANPSQKAYHELVHEAAIEANKLINSSATREITVV